jgi:hypothetical protein
MPENTFPSRSTEIRFLAILFIVLSFFFVASYVVGSRVERENHSVPTELVSQIFPEVVLEAKSVFVYDVLLPSSCRLLLLLKLLQVTG